ncbi:hypothetical protein [Anaerocolumna sp. MB42-C2]|uniref:hypothetical protein n=1 Tax=Anaerocolumna sp. MB42-C2 TaxID=3070997 RepID=UPI0027E158D8|nr:hypothetical protein [Anaerocolumna sp. MB42-C2]WMJ89711.1 hypothetical protein RBU59_09315 [Anaerocolumna sp. MB42-C2]
MIICPVCKSEYQEGYKICSDCKCDLIEIPDVVNEKYSSSKSGRIVLFLLGILIILCSPLIAYQITKEFFIPDGNGFYDPDQFEWMLNAFYHSFLLTGSIICLTCIIFWIKSRNSK